MKEQLYLLDNSNKLFDIQVNRNTFKTVASTKDCNSLNNLIPVIIISDGINLHYFLNELKVGQNYRKIVIRNIKLNKNCVLIQINPPKREILDYEWNYKILQLVFFAAEFDNIFSWMSTLGGAFSSLGDQFSHFADKAGEITAKQLKIAKKIGDPSIVSRVKLYFTIALIQKGYLRQAKFLIRQEYEIAKSQTEVDTRLIKMCQGIWSKLQYSYFLRKQSRLATSG